MGRCAYCGGAPTTVDHVPARVFLDEPYGANLSTVPACDACNNAASPDECYLACLLECVISGSSEVNGLKRRRIREHLAQDAALAAELAAARTVQSDGAALWTVDQVRVDRVVLKLARGHLYFEDALTIPDEPQTVMTVPLPSLSAEQRVAFLTPSTHALWPEIGSRGFLRAAGALAPAGPWIDVQEERYSYHIERGEALAVRMLLSSYLACSVIW